MREPATKPITTQRVSGILRAAGFKATKSSPSRIRGLRDWSPGYRVNKWCGREIHVGYQSGSFVRYPDRETAELEKYRAAIAAAGIACKIDEGYVRIEVAPSGGIRSARP